jgi:hypothetical protein
VEMQRADTEQVGPPQRGVGGAFSTERQASVTLSTLAVSTRIVRCKAAIDVRRIRERRPPWCYTSRTPKVREHRLGNWIPA